MRLALIAVLVSSSGCGLMCDVDEGTTYSCEPLPVGSPGCVGGPRWMEDGVMYHDAPETVFPVGCHARVPSCSADDGKRTFECFQFEAQTFVWGELG